MSFPSFDAYCEAACIKLWGQPDSRTKKELRWNGGGSNDGRSYDIRKRFWFDQGQKRGGSTLELVDYTKGRPQRPLKGKAFFEVWREAHTMGIVPDPAPAPNGRTKWPILAIYPYTDENNVLLFEVVRFDTTNREERFRQRRPDGSGGWIWDLKGVRRVLFRLPELVAAVKAGQRVLICEGEKDCLTAVKLGYAATTMCGGVGKWRKEYTEALAGADVAIISDNDPQAKDPQTGLPAFHPDGQPKLPGQDHAASVARRVSRVAASVRVIMFQQKDLSDWVAAGGTREQLDTLIEQQAPKQTKQGPTEEEEEEDEAEKAERLSELNINNCVVLDGGKTMVLRFEQVEHIAGGERYVHLVPTFLRFGDFRNFYLNRRIQIETEKGTKWVDLGSWWLEHSQRRQYAGVVFRPAGAPIINGRLNLWTGWGVQPKQGDWSLLRRHIREVLAAGDESVYQYILNWHAWTVQHPGEQAEVALVFIGERGTGKGTLGKALSKIFGQHALHLSSPEHLTGRFNAHLRQCCFLFADEAYGPKDKSAEGTFKRLVTEDTLTIEQKGRDPIEVPNLLHIMMASNSDWVVPAGAHERRFMVQKVSEAHRQDPAWFGPLYKQMRQGGYAAMLFDLLARDLGDWHPRDIVRTEALTGQQEESLSPLDAWWFELLQTGVLSGADEDDPDRAISTEYEEEIEEPTGWGGTRKRTVRHEGLFDQARRISPKLKAVTDAALGRYLTNEQGCKRAWVHRERGWQFPPLADCRARWLERFPDTKWHDLDLEIWTVGED
jgi:Family of unknown function (DUF5906)